MVKSIHAVLRNALQYAVREEVLPRNVAKLVPITVPKYKVNRGLTVADTRRVVKLAKDERLYALYFLALSLGLRRGGLLGLRWTDIDMNADALEVSHSFQRVGGTLRLVPPKTEDSARTIPIPPICKQALLAHFDRQAGDRGKARGCVAARALGVSPRTVQASCEAAALKARQIVRLSGHVCVCSLH